MLFVNGRTYQLAHNHKEAWNAEAFRERYSDVLDRYDFIVGDWGYSQLRLKGFFKENNPRATKETSINGLLDYLNEYCNFGCAYFVIERVAEPNRSGDTADHADTEASAHEGNEREDSKDRPNRSEHVLNRHRFEPVVNQGGNEAPRNGGRNDSSNPRQDNQGRSDRSNHTRGSEQAARNEGRSQTNGHHGNRDRGKHRDKRYFERPDKLQGNSQSTQSRDRSH